jgi:hypothetical protein
MQRTVRPLCSSASPPVTIPSLTISCSSMMRPASCSLASSSRSLADAASASFTMTRCLRILNDCRWVVMRCRAAAGSPVAAAAGCGCTCVAAPTACSLLLLSSACKLPSPRSLLLCCCCNAPHASALLVRQPDCILFNSSKCSRCSRRAAAASTTQQRSGTSGPALQALVAHKAQGASR